MAGGPIPNPILEATCAQLEPLGWTWDAKSQSCMSPPGGQPAQLPLPTLPGQPPATTNLPTGHVIVSGEEMKRIEARVQECEKQRLVIGIGGAVAGLVIGALAGYAVAK